MTAFLKLLNIGLFIQRDCRFFQIRKSFRRCRMGVTKRLAAFDFDMTIVGDNTDTAAINLLPKKVLPKYNDNLCWPLHMRQIFELLHKHNVAEEAIANAITQIEPIDGMCQLIQDLSENLGFDVIIISDSNSFFIHTWLNSHNLAGYVKKVFTNPAKFEEGLLQIEMYHEQNWCSLSDRNLCKGYILEDFVKEQSDNGVCYEQIVYVGDGENDFCPILRLHEGDFAFCRRGYRCAKLVEKAKGKTPIKDQVREVKAVVHLWNNGFDILEVLKK